MKIKLSNILWSLIGIVVLTILYLLNSKKDVDRILYDIDEEAKEKQQEVKDDLAKMSDADIIDKYGDRESASRIINESRSRLANRAREILSGFGSSDINI